MMETGYLFPLFFIIALFALYFGLMAWVAVLIGHWFWSWFAIAVMVSPFCTVFFKVQRENLRRWWKATFHQTFEWNIEKTMTEYLDLIEKQKKQGS